MKLQYLIIAYGAKKSNTDNWPLALSALQGSYQEFNFLQDGKALKNLQDKVMLYKFAISAEQSHAQLRALSETYQFDFFIFNEPYIKEIPKLVVFDMDSTLIPIEVIDELAEEAGCKNAVSQVTEAAMRGELDFKQSLRKRVSQLKGLSEEAFEHVKTKAVLNPGVEKFCQYIVDNGGKLAIASGGFVQFAQYLQTKLPFHQIAANQLVFEQSAETGKILSGEVLSPIIDAQAKADCLKTWRKELNLKASQTMAIGDGANDLLMLKEAGFGAAYHAKPAVNAQVSMILKFADMAVLIEVIEAMLERK